MVSSTMGDLFTFKEKVYKVYSKYWDDIEGSPNEQPSLQYILITIYIITIYLTICTLVKLIPPN